MPMEHIIRVTKKVRITSLESLWVIFVILLITSFYWWGRLEFGVLIFPLAILFVPVIGLGWFFSFSLRKLPGRGVVSLSDRTFFHLMLALTVMFWGMLASILTTLNFANSVGVISEMFIYCFLFFLIIETVSSEKGIQNITIVLIIGITILAIEGCYHFFITKSIWRLGAGDVHTYTNMGAFMYQGAMILTLAKVLFDDGQRWLSKSFFLLIAAILTTALLLSYSRGAWITLMGALGIFVWRKRTLVLPLLVVPLLGVLLLPDALTNRFMSAFSVSDNPVHLLRDAQIINTTQLRFRNVENTFDAITQAPVLGKGIGFYHGETDTKGERAPHNGYLRIWAESGVVAALGFVWFVSTLVYSFAIGIWRWREKSQNWVLMGYFALVCTHALYLCLGDWSYQMYFWVFSGLAASSLRLLVAEGDTRKQEVET